MNYDIIRDYVAEVMAIYDTGVTTESSYRGALEKLFNAVANDVRAINEPTLESVGRPDFVFKRKLGQNHLTIGHCEAKDIDKDVSKRGLRGYSKDQYARYTQGLPNLIYTNQLEFHFYREGELIDEIRLADLSVGIQPIPKNYPRFAERLQEFTRQRLQTITSPERLAKLMAGKALLVKEALFRTLEQDKDLRGELAGQYTAFKDQLIHDLTPEGFADIYAETVAYGLFAARLHDEETLEDFSREEALHLLPKSNPFLRKLFEFIARQDLDDRIKRDIDELAEIFQATNLQKLFETARNAAHRADPFIHFYETFLAEYNPKKRKARGVWYTPEPVVNFIVRAVDDVLKSEFGLPDGLADTSKIVHEVDTGQTRTTRSGKTERVTEKREMHRVQVLDPATGTGTFLAEVIRLVGDRVKGIAPGKWSGYVEEDLIPRLHGFELLMASYAMCHMKLDMQLTQMGYTPRKEPPRLNVFLTNSLEEPEEEVRDLLMARWLSDEAQGANAVKRDKPIMCIIGNPPYSGESANKGNWIMSLMEAYKKEPGGTEKLKERNPKWINDDYVKFIRFSEHLIEQNGEGVLAFITNHGYLDNPTFRGMRWHLLKTFDKIWVLDLHGNAKKKEVTPEGKPDTNVFDIQQGVALIVAVKKKNDNSKDKSLGTIWHGNLWGTRKTKYSTLMSKDRFLSSDELAPHRRYQMFYPIDDDLLDAYDAGFQLAELFERNQIGLTTSRDNLAVAYTQNEMMKRISEFVDDEVSDSFLRGVHFPGKSEKDGILPGDTKSWSLVSAREALRNTDWRSSVKKIDYRPLDTRQVVYSDHILERSRSETIPQLFHETNFAISFNRKIDEDRPFSDIFVFRNSIQLHSLSLKESNYFAPLYLYPEPDALDQTRRVNMDPKIRKAIEDAAEHPAHGRPDEVAIFDYIYGVLHCPAYRETYAEFLKIDFPRVPYPSSPDAFWDISAKGTQLRRLHLMEPDAIGETPYPYVGEGDDVVLARHPKFDGDETGTVFINKTQGFENVPRIAWDFYIGGYQPAQKWLKDRKDRTLSMNDIRHYQRIVKILLETDRIMKTIEMDL